jgi:hypothetical protein
MMMKMMKRDGAKTATGASASASRGGNSGIGSSSGGGGGGGSGGSGGSSSSSGGGGRSDPRYGVPSEVCGTLLEALGELQLWPAERGDAKYELLLTQLWAAAFSGSGGGSGGGSGDSGGGGGGGYLVADDGDEDGAEVVVVDGGAAPMHHGYVEHDIPFERESDRYRLLGFQGSNPDNDFHGAGMLSLQCLVYLAQREERFYKEVRLDGSDTSAATDSGSLFRQMLQQRRGTAHQYPLAPCAVSLTCFLSSVFELEAATSEAKARTRRLDSLEMAGLNELDSDAAEAHEIEEPHAYKEQPFWELLLERGQMGFYEVFCIAFEMMERAWRAEMRAEQEKGPSDEGAEGVDEPVDPGDANGAKGVALFAKVLKRTKGGLLQLLSDANTGATLASLTKAALPPIAFGPPSAGSSAPGQAGGGGGGTDNGNDEHEQNVNALLAFYKEHNPEQANLHHASTVITQYDVDEVMALCKDRYGAAPCLVASKKRAAGSAQASALRSKVAGTLKTIAPVVSA